MGQDELIEEAPIVIDYSQGEFGGQQEEGGLTPGHLSVEQHGPATDRKISI
jgi:hypothetical protein